MLRERIKLALSHAIYTAGLTFFSTLASQFADQILMVEEVMFSGISCFITFGIAFFTSMKIQEKSMVNPRHAETHPTIKEKKLKNSKTKILNKPGIGVSNLWKKIFIVTHSP
jgi:hypothetical protein